ncbi:8661_t:CDS:1, partial [Ambispora gerdemannii]
MPGGRHYLVKSLTNSHEVNIKEYIQKSDNIKPIHFQCTCSDFKFRGIACKHIFTVCRKFYPVSISYVAFAQEVNEPEEIPDIIFEDWIGAIRKVWNRYDQIDRNQMTGTSLEAIVDAGMKRKSIIPLYDECVIPDSEMNGTYY